MLVKFNSLIKMATCMLAKKFTAHTEEQTDAESREGKSRGSGREASLEDRISEEMDEDEVMRQLTQGFSTILAMSRGAVTALLRVKRRSRAVDMLIKMAVFSSKVQL